MIIYLVAVLLFYSSLPSPLFSDPACCLIEDRTGELLGARIAADEQWRFPANDKVSEKFVQALVTFEDRRFYTHQGVDGLAIVRAIRNNIRYKGVKEGGSTLSMQVIRLMRKGQKRTFTEKVVEAFLAIRLEAGYSKAQILALYASHAPFGSNVVGIDAAAWRYFGREAEDLSWAEAATLAVLPNAPGLIHPGRNRAALKIKRDLLLDQLHAQNCLDEETCALAKAEPLPERPLLLPQHAPHLLDRVAKKYPMQRSATTLSLPLQKSVNSIVDNHVQVFKANMVNNAAVLVADVKTGQVLAYVGNAFDVDDKINGSKVDVITAPRSTGSILKPFLYAAMLDEGELLPNMLLPDVPLHIAGFSPNNYNKTFDGAVPAHEALERSLNVPSVRMLLDYNVDKFHSLLMELGMTTLSKPAGHYGLSLILGGAEGTLWDISTIYANLAREVNNFGRHSGKYNEYDWHSLNFLQEENADLTRTRLTRSGKIDAAAVFQTLEALSELNRPEEESSWKMFSSGRKVAWKTGTSYGNRDAWAVGVTPDYVVGVWVGNANGEGRPLLTGVGYAAPLLFDVFNLLPNSHQWFGRPYDEMSYISVCRKSGHRSTDLCTETDSIWVVNAGLSSAVCPYHILVHLDASGRYRVNSNCYPLEQMQHRSWFILPPAQEWYYRHNNADYPALPPWLDKCVASEGIVPMQLIYPSGTISLMVPRLMDGSVGKVIFQAAHTRLNAAIFWHVDEEYIGTTQDNNHQLPYTPTAGFHRLTLIDDEGNKLVSSFEAKEMREE